MKTIEQTHDTKAVQQALALLEHNAPSTSGIDLGDLADDTSGVETGGPITGDPIKGGFTGTPQEPEANASTDTQLGADWGDLGDANLTIDDNTLPPELAAVV